MLYRFMLLLVVCVGIYSGGCYRNKILFPSLYRCQKPSTEEQRSGDYGYRMSQIESEKVIAYDYEKRLYDPYTAYLKFSGVSTGYYQNPSNCKVTYGRAILVQINAKNRYGGYTGYQTDICILRNGVLYICEDYNGSIKSYSFDQNPRSLLNILEQKETPRNSPDTI